MRTGREFDAAQVTAKGCKAGETLQMSHTCMTGANWPFSALSVPVMQPPVQFTGKWSA